jgi:hypothetical protein
MTNSVIVTQVVNDVLVSTPGPQGPRGRTILNGSGAPSNNFGLEGDFYFDTAMSKFYGPKPSDSNWDNARVITLSSNTLSHVWELAQVTGPVQGIYSVIINHNLGYNPNVTIKSSAGDVLETGIDYNNINQITLTMAQPFSGTAHLS